MRKSNASRSFPATEPRTGSWRGRSAELRFGVGIHRGEAVAGVVGNDELAEFTVIGDPVNVAARVEQLTRTHGVDILVTDAVRRDLDERFRVRPMPAAV